MAKLLIVDDNPLTMELLTTLFELEGFQVASVRDGSSVLPAIAEQAPALVLMDFYLGKIEATDLVREIRGAPVMADIPIVVVSGADKAYEVLSVGANRFLQKPFEPARLLEIVSELV